MGRTDRYAAPEQLTAGQLPDERTDIYAFGRILEQLPGARRYRKIISRCTAPEPERRYQSAQELLAAIQPKVRRWHLIAAIGLVGVLIAAAFLLYPPTATQELPLQAPNDSITANTTGIPVTEPPATTVAATEINTEQQPTKEAPRQETAAKPTPTSSTSKQEVIPSPTPTAKKMTTEELQEKLRAIMQPIYAATLEPLKSMPYNGNEQLLEQRSESFFEQLRNVIFPLSDELIESGAVSRYTFFNEWGNIQTDYVNSTYQQMVSNNKK